MLLGMQGGACRRRSDFCRVGDRHAGPRTRNLCSFGRKAGLDWVTQTRDREAGGGDHGGNVSRPRITPEALDAIRAWTHERP